MNLAPAVTDRLVARHLQKSYSGRQVVRDVSISVARGEVVKLLSEFDAEPLGIYAVLPSNRYIPHRVKVLMEFLAQAFKGSPDHFGWGIARDLEVIVMRLKLIH